MNKGVSINFLEKEIWIKMLIAFGKGIIGILLGVIMGGLVILLLIGIRNLFRWLI